MQSKAQWKANYFAKLFYYHQTGAGGKGRRQQWRVEQKAHAMFFGGLSTCTHSLLEEDLVGTRTIYFCPFALQPVIYLFLQSLIWGLLVIAQSDCK